MKARNFFKALIFAGFLSCCSVVLADPLNNWHWRNPLPNGNPAIGSNTLYGLCFTNGTFFGAGAWGTIATSTDGRYWTENPSATTNQLYDIINVNGQFVAVGNNGAIETSPDGTNWTLQSSTTANQLSSVAYGNGTYCALGPSVILTSADGVSWNHVFNSFHGASAVAGSSYGFVAITGTNLAYFSSNGRTWSTNSLPANTGYMGGQLEAQIVTYWNGLFLIGGASGPPTLIVNYYILASPDGINWPTNVYTGNGFYLENLYTFFMTDSSNVMAYGVAGGANFLQASSDGLNWSMNRGVPQQGIAGAYGNGTYVVTGGFAFAPAGVYASTDNVNWAYEKFSSSLPTGPQSTFNSIAYSNGTYVIAASSSFVVSTNDSVYTIASNTPALSSVVTFGTNFISVGANGQIYLSTNGFAWKPQTSNSTNNLHGVAARNNLAVAVGDNGTVLTSPNGITWTSQISGTALSLNGVVYSNGLYVAVGQQGTILTSPNGTTWTARSSGVVSNLLAVTYGPAGFLAAGANGTILTSLDGVNWIQQNSGTSATLETATAGSGYYLVSGAYATVLTSFDGVNWMPRNVGATGSQTFYGSGFLNGRFDVVGAYGNILESDVVPQIFTLQIKNVPPNDVVTAFVTPGSTFRILSSTNLIAPAWPAAATFNNALAITFWTNNASTNRYNFYRLISP